MTDTQTKKWQTKRAILGILFVIVVMALYGYYEVALKAGIQGSTLIDNPTDQTITVDFDGQAYTIPADSYVKVQTNQWTHTLSSEDLGLAETEISLEPTQYGVINPTQSQYVTYNMIYTKKDLSDQFEAYNIDGKEVYSLLWEPELSTAFFIPDRTLGKGNLDDTIPETVKHDRKIQDYAFLAKIFRIEDFFDYYDEHNK